MTSQVYNWQVSLSLTLDDVPSDKWQISLSLTFIVIMMKVMMTLEEGMFYDDPNRVANVATG